MSTLALILLAILASALFSGSETALITTNKVRLRYWVEKGARGHRVAERYLTRPQRTLSLILVGTNVANVSAAVLTAKLVEDLLVGEAVSLVITALIIPVVLTPPLLILGEIIPKTVARDRGSLLLPVLQPILLGSYYLLRPLIWVSRSSALLVLKAFAVTRQDSEAFFSRRNIEYLIKESEEAGVVEPREREMISGLFAFGQATAREVMVPRTRIVAAEQGTPPAELARLALESGYSRIPLYAESLDHVVGMVHVFDLLKMDQGESLPLRPVYHTPETKACDELFLEMKVHRCHMAIVLDEYGGTAGLLTLEDLIEELVGEIEDEYDPRRPQIVMRRDRSLVLTGTTPLSEVAERLGIDLPRSGAETIGGFVLEQLGRFPEGGEELRFKGLHVEVLEATPRRVEWVLVKVIALEEEHG